MRLSSLFGAIGTAALLALAQLAVAAIPASEITEAIEFYHAGLDHYVMTAEPGEINDLDTGRHVGWVRTGYRFSVVKAGSTYPGSVPMCRFYSPSVSTHFYTAKAEECEAVKVKFADFWQFESGEVFRAFLVNPQTGACPADTVYTHRLFNKRADPNHRYTTQLSVFAYMVGKGYQPEGDGNPQLPVAFCTPGGGDVVPPPTASAPSCMLTANTGAPVVGTTLALAAICVGSPTSFMWTSCNSTGVTCNATRSAAGPATYTLYAANAAGPGAPVTLNVTWSATTGGGAGSGAVPICTLSSSALLPPTTSSILLTANCSQTPTSYEWLSCSYMLTGICNVIPSCPKGAPTCSIAGTVPGFARYMVAGTNGAGTGPRAQVELEWTGGSNPGNPTNPNPTAPPVCSLQASDAAPTVGSLVELTATCSNSPTQMTWSAPECAGKWTYCALTATTTGPVTYSVVGANAIGGGAPAATTVNWMPEAPVTAVPVCTLTPSTTTPYVGATLSLSVACTNKPRSYTWTGCSSTGTTCTDGVSAAGSKRYSVVATNAMGNSAPVTATVDWQALPPPGGGGMCSQFTNVLEYDLAWGSLYRYKTIEQPGRFTPTTAVVISITIPPTAATYRTQGYTSFAEWNGPPALRTMTLSREKCDFRAADPTGRSGPIAATGGLTPVINWNVGNGSGPSGLIPGQTYYFNLRNENCGQGSCDVSTTTNWPF